MYVVDTNILVEAQRRYYGFSIVPSFWIFLDDQFALGNLVSIRPVLNELREGKDELTDWANERRQFFNPVDDAKTLIKLMEIADWVNQQNFTQAAIADFLDEADYYLVAYAAAHQLTVLTHEHYSPDARKRVLIPNVCRAFGVDYIDTFEMMYRLEARI